MDSKITPKNLCRLIELIGKGVISVKIAKEVFEEMFYKGLSPDNIIQNKGLEQISDTSFIEKIIDKVIAENPGPVEQYQSGKEKAIGFLIGKVMAETKGKANPKIVSDLMIKKLKNSARTI